MRCRVPTQCRSGPQHSVRRLPGSGQAQCTSWRNFAPFSSSTFKNIHGEQAGKRDRRGSAVGARHMVREHATTQTVLNRDIKRVARLLSLESSTRRCSGSTFSAIRPGPAVQGRSVRVPLITTCPVIGALLIAVLSLRREVALETTVQKRQSWLTGKP